MATLDGGATFQVDTATEKNGEAVKGGSQMDEGVGEEITEAVDGGAVPDARGCGRGEGDDLSLHGGAECGRTRGMSKWWWWQPFRLRHARKLVSTSGRGSYLKGTGFVERLSSEGEGVVGDGAVADGSARRRRQGGRGGSGGR